MVYSAEKEKRFCQHMREFCRIHQKIYIYGAGHYGQICLHFLENENIKPEGFITTYGGEDVSDIPVYQAEKILGTLSMESGILIAMKPKFQKEIRDKYSFLCDTLDLAYEECIYLQNDIYLKKIKDKDKYPFETSLQSAQWKNILIVQLEVTFGDMIWSTAFIRELKANFPDSNIIVVMNSKLVSLYKNCPYINEVIAYEYDTVLQEISPEIEDKVEKFANENLSGILFDAVFLPRLLPGSFQDNWENILLALASGAKNRIAHAMYVSDYQKYMCDMVEGLFTVVAKHTEGKHEVLQDLDLLSVCGYGYVNNTMELWTDSADEEYASLLFSDISSDVILIATALIGSTETRSWSPYKYGNVFYELSKRYHGDVRFVLCGDAKASVAAALIPDEQKKYCIDITGKTSLTQAAAVIGKCHIYLGSDTGLMHMAASYGIPVIEISASNKRTPGYWGSSPTRTGPWKVDSIVLQSEKGLEDCEYFCNRPYAHCIDQITERQVLDAVEKMILKKKV